MKAIDERGLRTSLGWFLFACLSMDSASAFRSDNRAAEEREISGRVLDAFTSQPLQNVSFEAWTESANRLTGGFVLVAEAHSDERGHFTLVVETEAARAEKIRVRKRGYLAYSGTLSSLDETVYLFPQEDEPPRLLFRDVNGLPIVGVRVTSTYLCAHDVPAFDIVSGIDGVAELPTFGIQRDVPTLRVRAPGFRATKYLELEPSFFAERDGVPYPVTLSRDRSATLRLRDVSGDPLARELIHVYDGDGEHALRTDESGRLELPSRYGGGELTVRWLDAPRETHVGVIFPSQHAELSLRVGAEDWPQTIATARLWLDGEGIDVQLSHADGWLWSGSLPLDEPLAFPAGRIHVRTGAEFSGQAVQEWELDLAPGEETTLRIVAQVEPVVRVLAHSGWRVRIQAGDMTLAKARLNQPLFIPSDVRVHVILEAKEQQHIELLTGVTDGLVIDLGAVGPPPEAQSEPASLEFVPADDWLARGQLRLIRPSADLRLEVERSADGALLRARIEGTANRHYLFSYEDEDGVLVWFRGRLQSGDNARRILGPDPTGKSRLLLR